MKLFFKKNIKLIIFIILVVWASIFITDYNCAKNNKTPIFCIKFDSYWDGGTKEYLGLGYKIIKYHYFDEDYDEFRRATRYLYIPDKTLNKYVEYSEIGTLFLKYAKREQVLSRRKEYKIENISIINENDIEEKINAYIKENINNNFDKNNYKTETHNGVEKYIYYILSYDNIKTDLGYIIIINNEEIKIIDNMNNYDEKDILKEISDKIIESNPIAEQKIKESKQNLMSKAENDNQNSNIDIIDEFDYYYTKDKTFYHVLKLSIKDSNNNEINAFYDEQLD